MREDTRATALYLAPTKALAADQLAAVHALGLSEPRIGAYDGDTDRGERDWVRRHARWIFTNPDMTHHALLAAHSRWASFFRGLRYVVVDECHGYRGVFGSHVAHVIRRLDRICEHYGAHPTFIAVSATIASPEEFA